MSNKPIRFNCHHCSQPIEAPAEMLGLEVDCPGCNRKVNVRPSRRKQPEAAIVAADHPTPRLLWWANAAAVILVITAVGFCITGIAWHCKDHFDVRDALQSAETLDADMAHYYRDKAVQISVSGAARFAMLEPAAALLFICGMASACFAQLTRIINTLDARK